MTDNPETVAELQERVAELEAKVERREKRIAKDTELVPYQVELLKLQNHLNDTDSRMIVVFEGRDASGKGGAIRRITRYMNVKNYRVVALGKPTEEQRHQWYFQKYVTQFPSGREIVLFDRSWYNRAMVEPVFGFCTEEEYKSFLKGVVGFEKDLVRTGTILVKLYFSVTKDEQAKRFARRMNDPLRQWKLSEVDLQAQDKWEEFTDMKYKMLKKTSTTEAPWTIIRSGDKRLARVNAMRVILNAVDYPDRNPDLNYIPDPDLVLEGDAEIALMEAERSSLGHFTA